MFITITTRDGSIQVLNNVDSIEELSHSLWVESNHQFEHIELKNIKHITISIEQTRGIA